MINYTIISDPLDIKRRESLYHSFENMGIKKLNFTDAIMANRMSDKEVYTHTVTDTFLTKGEVGCVLSHKKVYEKFLDSRDNSIIIFEDDAIFTDKCSVTILKDILKKVDTIDKPLVVALQKSDYQDKEEITITADISMYSCHKFYCTHGYVINRAAAKNILKLQTPIRFEIDAFEYYYWLGVAELYCLNENLVVQSSLLESVIGEERFNSNIVWEKRMYVRKKLFAEVYNSLSFKEKLLAKYKHFKRVIHDRRQKYLYKKSLER